MCQRCTLLSAVWKRGATWLSFAYCCMHDWRGGCFGSAQQRLGAEAAGVSLGPMREAWGLLYVPD